MIYLGASDRQEGRALNGDGLPEDGPHPLASNRYSPSRGECRYAHSVGVVVNSGSKSTIIKKGSERAQDRPSGML